MAKMDWALLLCTDRLRDPSYAEQPHRPIFVQDYDRIAFSAPFQRLANKTQVHPLYEHDHLHHRLIHSIETSSVGRSLGMAVGHWLEESNEVDAAQKHTLAGMVQAACLAHDIGNPPFGHSGEEAIGQWFSEKFQKSDGIFGTMDYEYRGEFEHFEGNAQGLRIIARLEMYRHDGGMRLSHGVIGAFSKYPCTRDVQADARKDYALLTKAGIFQSEHAVFSESAEALGLIESGAKTKWWKRHPLAFLVEAADDICYNILDLEDAFTCGDLEFAKVRDSLEPICGPANRDTSSLRQDEAIAYLRARSIGSAIASCIEAFKDHYAEIMHGELDKSLVDCCSKSQDFAKIKALSKEKIFTARRKTELEVSGKKVIFNCLDGVLPLFEAMRQSDWDASSLSGYHAQLARALDIDLRNVTNSYEAFHAMTDYVSGMTDRYAVDISRMLSGT